MGINRLKYIGFFLSLVLLQVWVFNRVHLFAVATPLFYIYIIMKLPADMNRNLLLLISFVLGFVIDLFGYTLGLNMLACSVLGFLRYYALNFFAPRDLSETYVPSMTTFGPFLFMRYAFLLVLVHHITFFVTESFSFLNPPIVLLRIVSSTMLTLLLILGAERLNFEFLRK